VILESQYYGIPRDAGYWDSGRKYLEAMEAYHASYLSAHWRADEFLKENRPLIDKVNLRLGHRLVLTGVMLPETMVRGREAKIEYRIRNAGVAPCLPDGHVAFTFRRDHESSKASTYTDKTFHVKTLAPNSQDITRTFSFDISKLAVGRYSVWISIGDEQGRPKFELPLSLPEMERRYQVGYVPVE
jgi:hypothetical protein